MNAVPTLSILLWVLAGLIGYYFLSGFIWGAGYAPTSKGEIDRIAELLNVGNGKFYDLGSGFGRIVISLADRYDANCVGVEVDPLKCWWSNLMIRRKKLQGRISMIHSNFLNVNLGDADKVFIFLSGGTDIMERLRKKMWEEMKPESLVVSYVHKFSNWTPVKRNGRLFLYSIPTRASRAIGVGDETQDTTISR